MRRSFGLSSSASFLSCHLLALYTGTNASSMCPGRGTYFINVPQQAGTHTSSRCDRQRYGLPAGRSAIRGRKIFGTGYIFQWLCGSTTEVALETIRKCLQNAPTKTCNVEKLPAKMQKMLAKLKKCLQECKKCLRNGKIACKMGAIRSIKHNTS